MAELLNLALLEGVAICDGACSGNPGPGGWGYAWIMNGSITYKSGNHTHTTNNIMEMTAVLEALALKPRTIYTDSSYVANGIRSWMHSWVKNGWKTYTKKPVKNLELWKRLYEVYQGYPVKIEWVPGHADPASGKTALMQSVIYVQNLVDELAQSCCKN